MRQHALVAFDEELFDIGSVVRLFDLLLAETAEPAKLPDPILPAPHPERFIQRPFPFRHNVPRVIHPEIPIGQLVNDVGDEAVQQELGCRTQHHRRQNDFPFCRLKQQVDQRDQRHRRSDHRTVQLHTSPYRRGVL